MISGFGFVFQVIGVLYFGGDFGVSAFLECVI